MYSALRSATATPLFLKGAHRRSPSVPMMNPGRLQNRRRDLARDPPRLFLSETINKMSISFRLLEPSDFERGFLKVLTQLAPVSDMSESNFRAFYEEMCTQGKRVYVGEIDGCIVCTGTLLLERKFFFGGTYFGHVEDVVVDVNYRGKGYGMKLMELLIDDARRFDCARMVLDCIDDKVEFYKKCGFYRRGNQMNLEFHR
jgi:glucosamine-phosphate N-acetyltransferase